VKTILMCKCVISEQFIFYDDKYSKQTNHL